MNEIIYTVEKNIKTDEYKDILIRSTLGKRRPIEDLDKMEKMCKNATLIITARLNGRLIGIARALTDYAFSAYLADLAVDEEYQKQGIGKKLIIEVKKNVKARQLHY